MLNTQVLGFIKDGTMQKEFRSLYPDAIHIMTAEERRKYDSIQRGLKGSALKKDVEQCMDTRANTIYKNLFNSYSCSIGACLAVFLDLPSESNIIKCKNIYEERYNLNENKIPLEDVLQTSLQLMQLEHDTPYFNFYLCCIINTLKYIKEQVDIGRLKILSEWKELETQVKPIVFFNWMLEDGFELHEILKNKILKHKKNVNEGGSNPETTKQNATNEACILIRNNIDKYLDVNGKIGISAFSEKVKACMEANGNSHLYQQTACNNFFHNDSIIQSKKRGRGRGRKPRLDA